VQRPLWTTILDDLPTPHLGHQFVLGHQRAIRPRQHASDLQCAVTQLQRPAVKKELAPGQVQTEPTKAEHALSHETLTTLEQFRI
jgi:hypothetical protein